MQKFLRYDIEPEFLTDDLNKAKVVIKPLEQGFGTTLGNALRRICLSNIPGASMFAIKIPGVTHEYQAIDGVVEDVTQIILNLKKLVIRINPEIYSDEDLAKKKMEEWPTLKIDFKGPGNITGADIICPTGFEVVNKDLHIASISQKIDFQMEIFAKTGRGFRTFSDNKEDISTLSIIPTDSNFSPVLSFNYEVVEAKTSKQFNTDILTIELATNGSISASEALSIAAKILMVHLEPIVNIHEKINELTVLNEKAEEQKKMNLFIPIEELDLTVRAYNALKSSGIHNLQELIENTKQQIEKIKNLGRKSVNEIIAKVHERGLKLRDE